MAGGPPDREHELLIGQDLRPAQLERAAERRLFDRERERERDVLDPDGLRGEMAVAEHRYDGRPAMQPRERADRRALRAIDDRRSEDGVRQPRCADQLFGVPLRTMIRGRSRLVPRADRAHVHESLDTRPARRLDHSPGAFHVHGVKGRTTHFDDLADAGALTTLMRARVGEIAWDQLDPEAFE